MKLYRNAIILVVVLILLVGAYFFINNKKLATPDATDESTPAEINVIKVEQEKIILLEFNNENGSFTLKKKDKAWTIDPASELPIDNSIAEASATDMSALVADKLIEEKATDLGKYGLDKPATVKIGLADGSIKELEIGSDNSTKDGTYIKNKGESKVYLISIYTGDKLKLSRGHFAKKEILPVEPTALKTFSYEKNGEMQFAVDISSESEMKITAPLKEEAEVSKIAPILQAVVQLGIKDIIEENPADLAKYGLDKPAYSIEYGDGKTTKKILFGKYVEKGSIVYAKFPEGKSVFTIDVTPLTFLDMKFSDVISGFIYLPNISNVNKIDLFIDGKTIVSDITTVADKKEDDKFKVDGKDANMENEGGNSLFRAFYQALIGITMNKYEPAAKPAGTPEISIKYYMKPDSKAVTIDF
ncbi:MAG: DUF4340 domain-containing protein, partial [Ruminiclostridium sp.]